MAKLMQISLVRAILEDKTPYRRYHEGAIDPCGIHRRRWAIPGKVSKKVLGRLFSLRGDMTHTVRLVMHDVPGRQGNRVECLHDGEHVFFRRRGRNEYARIKFGDLVPQINYRIDRGVPFFMELRSLPEKSLVPPRKAFSQREKGRA
jgi:hypothetical protein